MFLLGKCCRSDIQPFYSPSNGKNMVTWPHLSCKGSWEMQFLALKIGEERISLMVQWLRIHLAVQICFPGQETKIPHATGQLSPCAAMKPQHSQKRRKGRRFLGFLVAQLVKNLQCRKPRFDSWVRKICWRKDKLPTPVSWPGEFHRLQSLWGCKEPDTTE